MLSRENAKIVTFDWESALDFNGQAAPYIQYAHVRANSILRKFRAESGQDEKDLLVADFGYALNPKEVELIDLISRVPAAVQKAAADRSPMLIASLAYELARAFNDFYTVCPVLQAEEPARTARLRLVMATRQTVANCLALLGITAPKVM